MYGVDYVIPDFKYLLEHEKEIVGVFVSHPHHENMGALTDLLKALPNIDVYASDFTLNVSDPNLRSLKVNGEAIDLTNNKDGYTLTLNPGYGSQTYKIMAEDEAGNVTTIEFTLKAEWLKDKVIIPDVVLPLEGNESYNLGDGYWLVTRNTPEGPVTDNTVYSGNMPFYVNEGGDYTFTKVI